MHFLDVLFEIFDRPVQVVLLTLELSVEVFFHSDISHFLSFIEAIHDILEPRDTDADNFLLHTLLKHLLTLGLLCRQLFWRLHGHPRAFRFITICLNSKLDRSNRVRVHQLLIQSLHEDVNIDLPQRVIAFLTRRYTSLMC